MMAFRKGRFLYRFIWQLSQKYAFSLLVGVILGLAVAVGGWRLYPVFLLRWIAPVQRIGMIGTFTPTTLPLSIQRLISLGLTDLTASGQATSSLALSWEVTDDGKGYLFHLRDDLRWHNGKPVVAADVNYNIRNVAFSALDATSLKVTLQAPYSPLPTLLAKPIFSTGLRGFGPYRVAGIQLKGDTVVYLKLVPALDRGLTTREYRFYPTEALGVLGYKLGEVDELDEISSGRNLANWGRASVVPTVRYNRVVSLFFNLQDELTKDKSLRQALGYALPKFADERSISPISKLSWAYTDKVRRFDSDTQSAKKLLETSGAASGAVNLTITTFSQYVNVAQAIADSWSALGITTSVKVENTVPANYQVLLSAQDVPPDPDQYPFWHSTQTQTNITGYANVKIDKLLEDGRQEMMLEKRQNIYYDFQRRLVDDAPVLFLYYPTFYTVSRNKP